MQSEMDLHVIGTLRGRISELVTELERYKDASKEMVEAYKARVEGEGDPILEHYTEIRLAHALEELRAIVEPGYEPQCYA